MHDKTVTLTLTLETVRRLANAEAIGSDFTRIYEAAEAALPPEWEEGTVAWVTSGPISQQTHLCERRSGEWVSTMGPDGQPIAYVLDREVLHVEPLRVLGAGEIAVKRHLVDSVDCHRCRADTLSREELDASADLHRNYADALDAEERAR